MSRATSAGQALNSTGLVHGEGIDPRFAEWLPAPSVDVHFKRIPEGAENLGLRHAKTTNHDLRAVKSFFKSAREDDVIPEDPAAAVKGVLKADAAGKKRAFRLEELRAVIDVADPEWKSMILFGLSTGQRLADVATVRWSNVDLVKDESGLQPVRRIK